MSISVCVCLGTVQLLTVSEHFVSCQDCFSLLNSALREKLDSGCKGCNCRETNTEEECKERKRKQTGWRDEVRKEGRTDEKKEGCCSCAGESSALFFKHRCVCMYILCVTFIINKHTHTPTVTEPVLASKLPALIWNLSLTQHSCECVCVFYTATKHVRQCTCVLVHTLITSLYL